MSGEVERVARAIVRRRCEAFPPEEFPNGIGWQVDRGWRMAIKDAEAAIEAFTLRTSPEPPTRAAIVEECARVADDFPGHSIFDDTPNRIATAIRALAPTGEEG